jgi:hypothetical protein
MYMMVKDGFYGVFNVTFNNISTIWWRSVLLTHLFKNPMISNCCSPHCPVYMVVRFTSNVCEFDVARLIVLLSFLCPRDKESGGILIYPCPFVRPFVRSSDRIYIHGLSSYSFGATALIFCRMNEVCLENTNDTPA